MSEFDEALAVYNDEVRASMSMRGVTLVKSKGHGLELARAIKAHGLPAVLRVLRWWARSSHQRAQFYRHRDNGCTLTTMRRHFADLDGFATDERAPAAKRVEQPLPPSVAAFFERGGK